jgi:hypothetical protein
VASHFDSVLAALRQVLREAERRGHQSYWDAKIINRWIAQLPGAWWGRWRRLKLKGDFTLGLVERSDFISHLRATLEYLETYRRVQSKTAEPEGRSEFTPSNDETARSLGRSKWLN